MSLHNTPMTEIVSGSWGNGDNEEIIPVLIGRAVALGEIKLGY